MANSPIKSFIQQLKYQGEIGFWTYIFLAKIRRYWTNYRFSDEDYVTKVFNKAHDYPLNLTSPKTLNEKIQWLKLYDRKPIYSTYADKYAVRAYIKEVLGEEYLIPLVKFTHNYKEISPENFPDYPVIVKGNHDSGSFIIVKDKTKVNWHQLRTNCREWLQFNYYWEDREYPYKSIKPGIIVEKLLQTSDGKIPNDYKLNVFNGKVEFIYVAVDREGENKRNIYSKDWTPLYFQWAKRYKNNPNLRGPEVPAPQSLPLMIELAEKLGQQFPYVRIDFYDVDGKVYFGEITQFQGGGFDQMQPESYDHEYGKLIELPV